MPVSLPGLGHWYNGVPFLTKYEGKVWLFACKILVICQTALLWTSHLLHTEPSLGVAWGSCYLQWSSCNHGVNISAPLLDCTIVEQHAVKWFVRSEGVKPSEIHRRIFSTIRRKLYYAKSSVPMGEKVPKWQSKHCWWIMLEPSDHSTDGTVLNELMVWFKRTDGLLSLIWLTN
jgi:hypothetical protein